MKHSEFYRMTPAQKEAYITRMMPIYKALKKNAQLEIREYVLKNLKLYHRYADAVQ